MSRESQAFQDCGSGGTDKHDARQPTPTLCTRARVFRHPCARDGRDGDGMSNTRRLWVDDGDSEERDREELLRLTGRRK
jgi:hypothetical protein